MILNNIQMSVSRSQSRKPCFDLSKFYEDLNRVQNSIGKTNNREGNSSLNKNQNFQTKKEDRLLNLAAFKKDISSNSKLIKGKIHLEQTNDKNKINKTENIQKMDINRNIRMSQASRDAQEDRLQHLRTKMLSWKLQDQQSTKQRDQSNDCIYQLTANNSRHYDYKNDFHLNDFEQKTTSYEITKQNAEQNMDISQMNSKLLKQLTKRNKIYTKVQRQIKIYMPQSRQQNKELSIALKQHFRENSKMVEIIQRFKKISGVQINDLHQLYDLLSGNSRQLDDPQFQITSKSIGITEKSIFQR